MGILKSPRFLSSLSSVAGFGAVALMTTALSGCYVVPLEPHPGHPVALPPPTVVAPPGPVSFPVRLYPANELASRYGVVMASVTNDLQGRGSFTTAINGEAFSGEATRKAGSSREGVANGAGNRGSYLACSYSMNNPSQGTGQCRLSDGALFTMHMGY